MNGSLEGAHSRLKQLWTLLFRPSTLEADPAFRKSLVQILYSGLRWGGVSVVVGVLAHVGISIGVWEESVNWVYSEGGPQEIALVYHVLVSGLGVGIVALSATDCSLSTGRFVGAVAALVASGATMHDDLMQGFSIAVEYVVMIYMVVVVAVPFRPWQALGVGGGILGLCTLLTGTSLVVPQRVAAEVDPWHVAPILAVAVVLGTAVSTVLYATRRAQHRVRRAAEMELAAAKERAEEALDTVEEQAERLRELDEMKSRFFANISHELRTPLSLMIGPVRQLLDRERPEDEAEILRIVHRNAERLERLVEQLLDLARYDADRLGLTPERQSWAAFVDDVVHRLSPLAERQGVDLSVQTAEADRAVVFDPDHMETIISNLVRNALTYTPREGSVEVRAGVRAGGEEARLVVADSGPGLSAEEQEVLFDRYYRGGEQAQLGGTGIGLALTKRLVDLHDGRVEVDSAPGEGSTFTVRWPGLREREPGATDASVEGAEALRSLSRGSGDGAGPLGDRGAAPVPAEGEDDPPETEAPVDRTTVLVVEDNDDVRHYVRGLLEPEYRVLRAENGREGVERARAALPDLVVSDVMMPEVDGFDMLRALRRSRRTDCIPVVMLTARVEEADQIEGLEVGAEAYLTKPFDAEVLTAQIDRLISTRQQLRERFREEEAGDAAPSDDETAPDSFEDRVRAAVRAHLADPDFSVERLAQEVGCTRRTLTRRTKDAVEQTPSQLLRTMRVERGAELLDEEAGTISEVAYAVGFNSLSYFSRCFKEHFGLTPSAYRQAEA